MFINTIVMSTLLLEVARGRWGILPTRCFKTWVQCLFVYFLPVVRGSYLIELCIWLYAQHPVLAISQLQVYKTPQQKLRVSEILHQIFLYVLCSFRSSSPCWLRLWRCLWFLQQLVWKHFGLGKGSEKFLWGTPSKWSYSGCCCKVSARLSTTFLMMCCRFNILM